MCIFICWTSLFLNFLHKRLKSRLKGAKRSVPIISETLLRNLWIYTDFVGLRDENCIIAYYDVPTQKNLLEICWTSGIFVVPKINITLNNFSPNFVF